MSQKITLEQKKKALEAIREHGTMNAGATAAGVSRRTLNEEMNRSAVFKKRVLEAREEGHRNMADDAIQLIKDYADGKFDKKETDRNRLTAAIAIANWAEPGFRGTTMIQGKIEHAIKVITGVPRPHYKELDSPKIRIIAEKKPTKDISETT